MSRGEKEDDKLSAARQLQQQGKLSQAIGLYEQIIRQDPQDWQAHHLQALAYAQQGDLSRAIHGFQQALALAPEEPVLHNNLANAYKQNQQLEHAIGHYQKAIALLPDYAQAQNNLAGIYALQGLYREALNHYKMAVHAEPDFAAAHFNLGLLLIKHRQLSPAYTQFNNVLALNPQHIESHFYIGVLDLEANRLDSAERAFQNVLLYDKNHVEALTNLGVIALKNQHGQLAIEYFTKALVIDNHHHEARNNLASTFMHHDRFENALMHYDVLLQEAPDTVEYLYNSGVAQMALGHLKEAINHFDHLLTIEKNHFAALNNLAAIHIRMGDRAKAQELLQRALRANPEDKASQHMLSALSGNTRAATTCPQYAENLFNNYALYYDQHVQKHLHYALPNHIVRLLDESGIRQSAHTLDLGCGTGLTGQVLRDISLQLDGVDIAAKMIAAAREKQVYDRLFQSEALAFLQKTGHRYDLIVAADVLPYFGDLNPLFQAVSQRISASGYFIFSVEISSDSPWTLQESARFCHQATYLQQLADTHGFKICYQQQVIARHQEGEGLPVLLVACKPAL